MRLSGLVLILFLLASCGGPDGAVANSTPPKLDVREETIARSKDALTPFFKPMTVQDGDWLDQHPEAGETFEEYLRSKPTLPTAERRTIYIQPVGKFNADQRRVIETAERYMKAFFNLPVKTLPERPLGTIPKEMSRDRFPNNRQIRTSYFLDQLLPPILPRDAAALICFTNYDLYPGDTWNFVFGQANLETRVGVWSLWRLERDGDGKANRGRFQARVLKIAMHETGHMFSMRHCVKYECLMSGTNHLEETDRRPLDTCPECTAKIAWAMNYPLAERYDNLAAFWKSEGNEGERSAMIQRADAVRKASRQ